MIERSDIEFIKESFKYALDRMTNLSNETWGSYELKQKRLTETKARQDELIKKLKEMIH